MSYSNTNLLLPLLGDDAGIVFPEYSAKGATITRSGTVLPTTSLLESKFYGSSGRFPANGSGTPSHLRTTLTEALGTVFTIQGWALLRSISVFNPLFYSRYNSAFSYTGNGISLRTDGTPHRLRFYDFGTSTDHIGVTDLSVDTWFHFELSRDSNNVIRMFINGNKEKEFTSTSSLGGPYCTVGINTTFSCEERFMQDIDVRVGVCLHTDNFTPPGRALGSISNGGVGAGKILDRNGNAVSRKLFAVSREYGSDRVFWGQSTGGGDYEIWAPAGAEYSVVALAEGNPPLNDLVKRVVAS